MFEIKSYIKIPLTKITDLDDANNNPDKYFVEVKEDDNLLRIFNHLNFRYIEGAIYIKYYDQVIIDFTYWDDNIDALWFSILIMIEEYFNDNKAQTSFWGHATDILIEKIPNNLILFKLSNSIETNKWQFPEREFINALIDAAHLFFNTMFHFMKMFDYSEDYQVNFDRINKLKGNPILS